MLSIKSSNIEENKKDQVPLTLRIETHQSLDSGYNIYISYAARVKVK